jgi:hypothetical protein
MITQLIENPNSGVKGNSANFRTIIIGQYNGFSPRNTRFYLPGLSAYTPQTDLKVIQKGIEKKYDNINTRRLRSNSRAIPNLNSASSKVLGNADLTSNIGSFLPQQGPQSNKYGGKKTKRLQKRGRKSKKRGRKSKKRRPSKKRKI